MAQRWSYSKGRILLSVCFLSTFSNLLSSETTGPIEAKFHMEPPWDGRKKVCSQDPGHMTKMSAMPIYGKNPSKNFKTNGPIPLKLGM